MLACSRGFAVAAASIFVSYVSAALASPAESTSPDAPALSRGARAVPPVIPFQGYLEKDGAPVDATDLTVDVDLYKLPTGGSSLWSESHFPVVAHEGTFTIPLGRNTPLDPALFGPTALWIEVRVEGQTLTPRTELLAAPFAIRALQADVANVSIADDGDWTVAGNTTYRIGPVGIGTNSPLAQLSVRSTVGSEVIRAESNNAPYISLWENGVYRGYLQSIGTSIRLGAVGTGSISCYTNGLSRLTVSGTGDVGVGTSPSCRLDVLGSGALATQVHCVADTTNAVALWAEAEATGGFQTYAVLGTARNQPGYGIGGYFTGGYQGLLAYALDTGSNNTQHFGAFCRASSADDNYAVYGTADSGQNNYAFYAAGDVAYTGSLLNLSDRSVKRDIRSVDSALDLVLALQPRSYEYRRDDPRLADVHLPEGRHYGFVAQEVERVAPELVARVVQPELRESDPNGTSDPLLPRREYRGIRSAELIPLLVRAIQEQEARIAELEARLR
ncbi:MAG: tail fiber domain-containing protein [Gemmatimonadetes bacterium]|nr:tail fiber domain-containing protein [Gemmatimonadota bacterium]